MVGLAWYTEEVLGFVVLGEFQAEKRRSWGKEVEDRAHPVGRQPAVVTHPRPIRVEMEAISTKAGVLPGPTASSASSAWAKFAG